MNKSILFVVNNLNIGGPQKSLLSLLYNFPDDYQIDIIVLNKELGLQKYLPSNVNLIHTSDEIPLLMLNKKKIFKLVFNNLFLNLKLSLKSIIVLMGNLFSNSLVKKKQTFWVENKHLIKHDKYKKYEFAIGVSGGHSIMYIVDFVDAKYKVGWIRTEYQNLNRDLELDKNYFEELNLILSVSEKCSEKFIEIFPEQFSKVHTFYNPLPYKMYEQLFNDEIKSNTKQKETIIISTISRLDKNKGFDLLIEAAKHLRNNQYKYIWNIYGVGPQKKAILKQIKLNQLENYVHLRGFEFNTGAILKNTDILVHPSKFEGKSNTIDEAKYYGIAIVSTNFPTVSEQLTNNVNAIITEMDGKDLYKGIAKMINFPKIRKLIECNLKEQEKASQDIFVEFMSIIESGAIND
ncbi:glycosyltransferase [Virgibacillus halodenitrificans]|uniref:glycosyltransferase n=1 Tax=Virgibacillus halodenitrificans TaxID=1482 RepID=UPI001FB3D63F|nr:glycosyltransferase [Virgibacillus halodenitrificans]